MKLQVLQENLSRALNTTSRFASTKAQLPVLTNILFEAQKNKLVISATNLETSISLAIGAKVERIGNITVPSRTTSDLISNLSPGQLDLVSKKERLTITSSGFKSVLSGMNSADFPKVPNSLDKDNFKVSASLLMTALSKIIFAVSSDETRPILTGVLIIIKGSNLTLVATDGFRLSQKKLSLAGKKKSADELNMILPKGILNELSRIADKEEEILFSCNQKDSQVIFSISDAVLSSRIIEGEFPDYKRIIPKESKIKVKVDKEELLQAVKLASVFARDSANVCKFLVKQDLLKISAESKTGGSQKKSIDAKVEGDLNAKKGFTIAFNYRFLEDFLNTVEGEEVEIALSDANAPALFLDSKDRDFLHIIMPVKLQD